MGSINDPKTWVPYVNTRDCTQGFCSLYCPQWCYIIFPPPPPPLEFPDDDSGPAFSPLVIAIIGILASAFLLISYYAIVSKFCRNRDASCRRGMNLFQDMETEEDRDPSNQPHWTVSANGLDEAMIKKITMFKYKKGDGLLQGTESTDCSVCLSEFQEDESLRLLPKCCHAFHVACIDTWLKSQSNCPLCRANVAIVEPAHHELLPPPVMETPPGNEEEQEDETIQNDAPPQGDVGNSETSSKIIEIRDDREEDNQQQVIRRSVSMDNPFPGRLSIADILRATTDDEEYQMEECRFQQGEMSRSSNRNKVLHCVASPVAVKRSLSSGRFAFSRRNRGRSTLIPL